MSSEQAKPPFPPFTLETAIQKVRLAEDGWNSRDPQRVSLAYTPNSRWRNRSEFLVGREEIVAFLTRKWAKELEYRLIKELWAFDGIRLRVSQCCRRLVSRLWKRKLGVRRTGIDGRAPREHQRSGNN